jgi:hypothetical protein
MIVACLALTFSMGGTGYAASRILITSTSQIKPSVLAKIEKATKTITVVGAPGPAGINGPAGAQGPAGAPGSNATLGEPIEVTVPNTGEGGAYAEALCPAGDVYLFGKGHVKGGLLAPVLEQETKVSTKGRTGWAVTVIGTNTVEAWTVLATAYCTK